MKRGKMMRISKICMLVLALQLMLLGAGLMTIQNASAKKAKGETGPFTISTSYGVDGYVSYDAPYEAKITLKSDKDFKGIVKLVPVRTTDYDYAGKTAYGTEISLAAGSEKTYSVMMPNQDGLSGVVIKIYDEKGKLVQSKKDSLKLKNNSSSAMMGILSDDYASISYLDQYETGVIYDGKPVNTSVMELTKDSLPDNADAMELFHYIVIDNFDTANLTDAQYSALKTWVNQGGVLIIGLGANYQNVLHIFNDDFISGQFGSIVKKNIEVNFIPVNDNANAEVADSKEEATAETKEQLSELAALKVEGVDALTLTCDGAQAVDVLGNKDLIYVKQSGRGNIVLSTFDLGMEPFISSDLKKAFVESMLQLTTSKQVNDRLMNNRRSSEIDNGSQLAEYADTASKPNAALFGLILLLYVLLVGPGIYLILKKMNKREKIWVAIPVISVAFTGIILLTSLLYSVKKPIVNIASILELKEDGVVETAYMDVTCPGARKYDIDFNENYREIQVNDDYMYNYNMLGITNNEEVDEEETRFICDVAGHKRMSLRNQNTFTTSKYVTKAVTDNKVGTVDLDLECTTKGFGGTISNNTDYDIKGAVVTFEQFVYLAGDIKAGETITIDEKKVSNTGSYGIFDQLMDPTGNMAFMKDPELKLQNIINCSFENMIMESTYNEGIFWGRIAGYKNDVVSDDSAKESNLGIIVQKFNESYADIGDNNYSILGTNNSITSTGDFEEGNRVLYGGVADVVYSTAEFDRVTSIEMIAENNNQSNWGPIDAVYFYNHQTNSYDKVFIDADKIEGMNVTPYIKDDNLTVRYEALGGTGYVPKIMLRGDKHADN